jgi:hypothetical protein
MSSNRKQTHVKSEQKSENHSLPNQDQIARQSQRSEVRQIQGQFVQMNGLPPEILERFEQIIKGSAQRLLDNTLQESEFRRNQEEKSLNANIIAQERRVAIMEYQTKSVFRSDVIGQIAGFIVCLTCIGGAIFLGFSYPESWKVPAALAAIPTAAIIKAFKISSHSAKDKKEDKN